MTLEGARLLLLPVQIPHTALMLLRSSLGVCGNSALSNFKDVSRKGCRSLSQYLKQPSTTNNCTHSLSSDPPPSNLNPTRLRPTPSKPSGCVSCRRQNLIFHAFHNPGNSPKPSVQLLAQQQQHNTLIFFLYRPPPNQ